MPCHISNEPGPLNIAFGSDIFHIRIFYILDFIYKNQMKQSDRHVRFECDVQRSKLNISYTNFYIGLYHKIAWTRILQATSIENIFKCLLMWKNNIHKRVSDYTFKTPQKNSPVVNSPHLKNPIYDYPH